MRSFILQVTKDILEESKRTIVVKRDSTWNKKVKVAVKKKKNVVSNLRNMNGENKAKCWGTRGYGNCKGSGTRDEVNGI